MSIVQNISKIISLLIIFQSTVSPKTTCQSHCQNYINLTVNENKLEIERKEIIIHIKKYPETIKISVLERKRYRVVIEKSWGDKPRTRDNMHLIPSEEEAQKWYLAKKCYIGTICPPNGDCWAKDANYCWEDKYENAVKERSFQFEGAQWSTSFHYACTQDYSCSNRDKMVQINFNNEFQPYIQVGDLDIIIPKTLNYTKTHSFGVFVEPISEIIPFKTTANCITQKQRLYCDLILDGKEIYFEVDPSIQKTSYNNLLISLGQNQIKTMEEQTRAKAASLTDINILASSVMVMEANSNYNDYITNKNMGLLINVINAIVISVSGTDPLLISRIMKEDIVARPIYRNTLLEICRCGSSSQYDFECDNFNKAHGTKMICGPPDKAQIKNLNLLKIIESKVTFMDHIKFRGVDKTIYEDHEEKEFDLDHHFDDKDGSSNPNFGIPDFFSLVSDKFVHVLLGIHSCLILLLLIRR